MSDPNAYDLKPGRSMAVLLVMQKFARLPPRPGAEKDIEHVQFIAKSLGMNVFNNETEGNKEGIKDRTKVEVEEIIENAVNYVNTNDVDGFLFIVSSHGKERDNPAFKGRKGHVFACSDDEELFVDKDVINRFTDEKCPGLRGKPKLFIIQACRGGKTESSGYSCLKRFNNPERIVA